MRTASNYLKIILVMAIILIFARAMLPFAVLKYANYKLNQIPNYKTKIENVEINLWRGAYALEGVNILSVNQNIPVPFISVNKIDLSIEWHALMKGSLVAQMILEHPKLNFVIDGKGKNEQTDMDNIWQKKVKALFPFRFNKIQINDGEIHLRNFTSKPQYNIYINHIEAIAANLTNADKKKEDLYAQLNAEGKTMDGASIKLSTLFDFLARYPTFYLKTELNNMNILALKDFLNYYTKLDIKQGYFSLFVEAAASKGKITGYVKPLMHDLKVTEENDQKSIPKKIYENIVQGAINILKNNKTKNVATKIKLSGRIDEPSTSIWSIIGNLLRNAFIEAILPKIDHTLNSKDIFIKG